jgi:hypothetical protein
MYIFYSNEKLYIWKGLKAEVSTLCDDFHCDSKSFMTIIMYIKICTFDMTFTHGRQLQSTMSSMGYLPWKSSIHVFLLVSHLILYHKISVYIYIQIYPESELWSASHLILYHMWHLLISIYRFTLRVSVNVISNVQIFMYIIIVMNDLLSQWKSSQRVETSAFNPLAHEICHHIFFHFFFSWL